MSFETFWILLIVFSVLFYGRLFLKGMLFTADEKIFRQAGVQVDFTKGTITVKGKEFPVGKVTGIKWESLTYTHRHGNSIAKSVIIDLDDFKTPHWKITFLTRGHAQKFCQRLSTALRKAGGPSFV